MGEAEAPSGEYTPVLMEVLFDVCGVSQTTTSTIHHVSTCICVYVFVCVP